jgi:hypothetical protein
MNFVFPINLMAQIPRDGSLKWSITSPYMVLLMICPNIVIVSFMLILNVGNGGNGIKIHVEGMLLGHNLWHIFMNTLTLKHNIWAI